MDMNVLHTPGAGTAKCWRSSGLLLILSPDITVSLETKSGLSASEIADRLKQILAEQANGGRK